MLSRSDEIRNKKVNELTAQDVYDLIIINNTPFCRETDFQQKKPDPKLISTFLNQFSHTMGPIFGVINYDDKSDEIATDIYNALYDADL